MVRARQRLHQCCCRKKLDIREFVNADEIARGLSPFTPMVPHSPPVGS
jgi:hypothetical protein